MAKLGFKPGEALGKRTTSETQPDMLKARAEPLNLVLKENRGGIGLDAEKKRKIREEAEEASKKIKQDEGDYRDRVREERETKRTEAQVHAAQKVAERLDVDAESNEPTPEERSKDDEPKKRKPVKLTSHINILYRGLVREREKRDQDRQAHHAMQSSLPSSFFPKTKLPEYDDPTLERDDKKALGQLDEQTSALEIELEEEDEELDAFNALEPEERLHKLVLYLREQHRYCFWCKYAYETEAELEGCPGLTEEDHD